MDAMQDVVNRLAAEGISGAAIFSSGSDLVVAGNWPGSKTEMERIVEILDGLDHTMISLGNEKFLVLCCDREEQFIQAKNGSRLLFGYRTGANLHLFGITDAFSLADGIANNKLYHAAQEVKLKCGSVSKVKSANH